MKHTARNMMIFTVSALVVISFQNCSSGFTPIDLSSAATGSGTEAGPLSLFGSKTLVASQMMQIYQSTKQYSDAPFNQCSLSIDGSATVSFGGSVRFNSTFVGDPTGITAEWAGTDTNVGNGNNETVIDNTQVNVTATAHRVKLVNADVSNTDGNGVGNYTRFLEYRRNGDVVCVTNMIMYTFSDQTTTPTTYVPTFSCNGWSKLQAGEGLSKNPSVAPGDSLYCEANFDSSVTAQITNLDTGLTNSVGVYGIDAMYADGWVQGRKLDGTVGLIFLGAVAYRNTVQHFSETVGTETVNITLNAGVDPGTGLCSGLGYYVQDGGGESYCGESGSAVPVVTLTNDGNIE